MNLANLEKILKHEPAFRLKQIKEAIFGNLINNWDEAINLPLELREKLKKEISLEINAEVFQSKQGDSRKALITLADGVKIETVFMEHKDGRRTVCVSSQAGCALGCLFCATGKMGFKRNLAAEEITEQVLFWKRLLKNSGVIPVKTGIQNSDLNLDSRLRGNDKRESRKIFRNDNKVSNVVFMGMGEPFLNYDNVLTAIKTINDKNGLNIGARHISISTAGIVERIKKLSAEPVQVNLALSLHAPNDKLREKIMPVAKKYKIAEIFAALNEYIEKTSRRVMLEYIMIKDLNDSDACAGELVDLIKKMPRSLVLVNLILYNETGAFRPSDKKRIGAFKNILEKEKITVTRRWRFGEDLVGACGQLAGGCV